VAGNINQLIFRLGPYVSNLEKSHGVMGEFVNPKYADAAKTVFKKPTRLECMMQDYPKVGQPPARLQICRRIFNVHTRQQQSS
jgi:UDP-sugar pyrophosphorylase